MVASLLSFLSLLCYLPTILSSSCMSGTNDKLLTCGDCAREAEDGCGWCLDMDPSNPGFAKGCVTAGNCSRALEKVDQKFEIVDDRSGGRQEYIKPGTNRRPQAGNKKVLVTSRPNVRHKIEFMAKKAENKVDIYFLVDLTNSMKETRNMLPDIFEGLVTRIEQKTKDFKFGFGSFSEKPTPPFDYHKPGKRYDFMHYQSMTKDTNEISKSIRAAKIHENNLDSAEGGFDGLMQLLLCSEEHIGWRPNTKGIIVFISDAASHLSGDGLLGGLWKPYEHKCNLEDPRNTNTTAKKAYDGLKTDYPSVSAIRHELQNHDKSIVFGTTQKVLLFYSKLVETLGERYASARDIKSDGRDLMKIVAETYDKIEGLMTINTVNVPSSISVNLQGDGQYDKIAADEFNTYFVEVTLKPEICVDFTGRSVEFSLTIAGQQDSNMAIEVRPVCECEDCNTPGDHSYCNKKDSQAKMICGSCQCKTYIGDKCQCNPSDDLKDTTKCQNEKTGEVCSGQGKCECERCVCNEGYSGEKCECDDTEDTCGDRGSSLCVGGKIECKCYTGWEHPDTDTKDCSCSTLKKDECQDPVTMTECNNRGNCRCNKCDCDGDFGGQFCQKDTSMTTAERDEETCKVLQSCVLAKKYKDDSTVSDSLKNTWNTECEELKGHSVYQISVTELKDQETTNPGQETNDPMNNNTTMDVNDDTVNEDYDNSEYNTDDDSGDSGLANLRQCTIRSKEWGAPSGCGLIFHHNVAKGGIKSYDEGVMNIEIKMGGIKCGTQVPMELLIGSSIGAGALLFLIGFLSYCIVINIRDRKEFKKYLQEKAELEEQGDYMENPAFRANRSSIRKSIRKSLMPGTKVSFGQGD